MTDQTIEQKTRAKGLTAPRITPADIEANIAIEYYFTASDGVDGADIGRLREQNPDEPLTFEPLSQEAECISSDGVTAQLQLLTFCVLLLRNGTKVVGINYGSIDPNQHDAELGKEAARAHAIEQVFPLMGYELRSKLTQVFPGGGLLA